ncbi:hypothetical protein ALC57_17121 [Trachymyrmex cornetzi]|uniref:Cytosolic fatty-acid binding proteins domain-containing protein n=1 Tax=Trachymyrmex cornetzi TaxID=471704 RepID=A0A195DCA0_9HYME|nr:hypothetical protein ALC57_17121 [Trachymyrmex cornetzi]
MSSEFLGKRYKLFSSENFDEFMKALVSFSQSSVIDRTMSSEVLTGILGKRYKLQSSEKFDEYMKALEYRELDSRPLRKRSASQEISFEEFYQLADKYSFCHLTSSGV